MFLPELLPLMPMHLAFGLFIETLGTNPQYFVMVIVTVVFSICVHELAHGVAAIKLGDNTPIETGHMTFNPIVHMGPFSLLVLAVAGIAWGAMPINPARLRGKYAEALVAVAGPASNLVLAIVGLVIAGLLIRFDTGTNFMSNAIEFMFIFGSFNGVLLVFNLLPVPPLDGSRILANFSVGYDRFISNPANSGIVFIMFPVVFFLSSSLFDAVFAVTTPFMRLIAGTL